MTLDAAHTLPWAKPSRLGVDARGIYALIDALERDGLDPHSLMIVRHGRVAAAGWWSPYRPADRTLVYSLSKSFTASAVGLAVAERRLSIDDPVTTFFGNVAPAALGRRSRALTVRHLLAMATGHERDTLPRLDPADPAGSFLALEPDHEPGSVFTYNNGATFVLSAIITAVTGQRLSDYLRPRLFAPLGVGPVYWSSTGGIDYGFSGLHTTTDAVARLGLLYLRKGRFAGRQVLPPDWVAQATARQVANVGRAETADWQQGYGFQFWRSQHGFRGDGAFGQFCLVLPDYDAVVAMTSSTTNMQGVLDRVWELLLPAFTDRHVREDPADDALAERLGALTVPVPVSAPDDAAPGIRSEHPAVDETPARQPLSLRPTGPAAPELALIRPAQLTQAQGGWELTLSEIHCDITIPLREGSWARTVADLPDARALPLAGTCGRAGTGRLRAEIAVLSTPHRLGVDADFTTGEARLAWHTAPLHPTPLSAMALPIPVVRASMAEAAPDHPAML